MLVNLAGWQNSVFETEKLKLGYDARASTSRTEARNRDTRMR